MQKDGILTRSPRRVGLHETTLGISSITDERHFGFHCFYSGNVRGCASMDQDRKRFAWGVGLAWLPLLSLVPGLFSAFRGVSQEKATGLAAVAGGLAEALAT